MNFKDYFVLFLKGLAMGAANVIPGVSGGTIAFITGIYEELIDSLKSFDAKALQLLLKFEIKAFIEKTNLYFLIALFAGIAVSIVSLAKVLEYLFCNFELLTLSFFFGLILASIYLVAKQVNKWSVMSVGMFLIGTAIAVGVGLLNPANQNENFFYLILCGIIAICSMVLPGLSGSYILLIMGNYLLVISSISKVFSLEIGAKEIKIIAGMAIGSVIGLIAFSNLLSLLFKKFKDATIALLAGFVLGSLYIIWPWKNTILQRNTLGEAVDKYGNTGIDECLDGIVLGYERYLPSLNTELAYALVLIIIGVGSVVLIDYFGGGKEKEKA